MSYSRERRRKRLLLVALALVVVLVARSSLRAGSDEYRKWEDGLVDPEARERPLAAEERAAIDKALANAKKRAEDADKAWRAEIDRAIAKDVKEDRDLGDCPIRVPLHPASEEKPPAWLNRITEKEAPKAKSLWAKSYAESAKGIEDALVATMIPATVKRLLEDAKRLESMEMEWEVALVADTDKAPSASFIPGATGGPQFDGGAIGGRAYLYDYRTKKIECATYVLAENSTSVKYEYQESQMLPKDNPYQWVSALEAKLKRDLLSSLYRKISDGMQYRAGPSGE